MIIFGKTVTEFNLLLQNFIFTKHSYFYKMKSKKKNFNKALITNNSNQLITSCIHINYTHI